jgi:hypothetical protein
VSSREFGAPFGGYKQIGLGRAEPIEDLFDNTSLKSINIMVDSLSA